eukprot:Selendium_serpulae@DN6212_c0_g1_i1.p1
MVKKNEKQQTLHIEVRDSGSELLGEVSVDLSQLQLPVSKWFNFQSDSGYGKLHLTIKPLLLTPTAPIVVTAPIVNSLVSSQCESFPLSEDQMCPLNPSEDPTELESFDHHISIKIKGTDFSKSTALGHVLTDLKAGVVWRGVEYFYDACTDKCGSPTTIEIDRNVCLSHILLLARFFSDAAFVKCISTKMSAGFRFFIRKKTAQF